MQPDIKKIFPAKELLNKIWLLAIVITYSVTAFAGGDEGISKTYIQRLSGSTGDSALNVNNYAAITYDSDYESSKTIQNIITLSFIEETPYYIPSDFSATVKFDITYGQNSSDTSVIVDSTLTVNYSTNGKYNPRSYISFYGWRYVKVRIKEVTASTQGSVDVRNILKLENEMRVIRYYNLKDGGVTPQTFSYTTPGAGPTPDGLGISWTWPADAGNNYTQLEWSWVEDEVAGYYPDTNSIFKNNATRVDLPANVTSYNIPLLYDDTGKLYFRIRAVSLKSNGSRSDGPWSDPQIFSFDGHNDSLNWQVTTSFAEEGKRKTVIQYFDGSLRSRQTVTKDNTTNTTVVAETFYDGQGRPAVQVLPAPGINNIIAYTKGLNRFNGQTEMNNPADAFDLQQVGVTGNATPPLNDSSGAAQYYSAMNAEIKTASNNMLPDAGGYPYTVTRYTLDATGRIAVQSGVGDSLSVGKGHETKYYYGTPLQEELDGLFGTEVGNRTHYFKNMVKDGNGQMSVSYVDMHGRTVATALAGDAPGGMQSLHVDDSLQYPHQQGTDITADLLDSNTNIVKNNSIESVNSLLVPATTHYTFNYQLTPGALKLAKCNNIIDSICYTCKYDLEISITNEFEENSITDTDPAAHVSDAPVYVKKYSNVNVADIDCSAPFKDSSGNAVNSFTVILQPGSYSVRKTLTLSEASLEEKKQQYLDSARECLSKEAIFDSVYASLKAISGCEVDKPPVTCQSCMDSLGPFEEFKTRYIAGLDSLVISDSVIHAAYSADSAHCTMLCTNVSHKLDLIKQQMIADMIPFSGQYATNPDSAVFISPTGIQYTKSTMYNAYDIFPTSNYKHPLNREEQADNYYNINGQADQTIKEPVLDTISPKVFTRIFNYSWAQSLLPHHPEYHKLLFAEDSLQSSYDWIDSVQQISSFNTAASNNYTTNNIVTQDPFFNIYSSAASSMEEYASGTGWNNGLTLWQIAYGDTKCKSNTDTSVMRNCYQVAPPQPDITVYGSLSSDEKDHIWRGFISLYGSVRDSMVNHYIDSLHPLSDDDLLIAQGYTLHFPRDNHQAAQQYNWTWYPTAAGPITGDTLPGISIEDSVQSTYTGRCSSYIDGWKNRLLQCSTIANSEDKDEILSEITSRMEALCQAGTDAANPYGSSTLPPNTAMSNGDTSFEQIVFDVLEDNQISKDQFCNPYVIEFPKPYSKGPQFSKQLIGVIDTCTCRQFAKITQEAIEHDYDPSQFDSLNKYLRSAYGDTLTLALFNGLQHCSELGAITCPCPPGSARDSIGVDTPRVNYQPVQYVATRIICLWPGFKSLDNDYFKAIIDTTLEPCTAEEPPAQNFFQQASFQMSEALAVTPPPSSCDTALYYYSLEDPQPLPPFLMCGFVKTDRCISCAGLQSLTAEFKNIFGAPYDSAPIFNKPVLDTNEIAYNVLYQKFINFRTGFQYTWLDYMRHAPDSTCNIDSTGGSNTDLICGDTRPLNDTTGVFVYEDRCQKTHDLAVSIADGIYEKRLAELSAYFDSSYRAKCLAAQYLERFTVSFTNKEYHYTLYYYDMAGNLVKTVPPKGVRPNFSQSFVDSVETARINNSSLPRQHTYATDYRYNSLNQVVAQKTPDADTSHFWYDRLGRLVISQNAKQSVASKYSYTLYDEFGRITEVAEITGGTSMTDDISKNDALLSQWLADNEATKAQITQTFYDAPYPVTEDYAFSQHNLRNRVSYTAVRDHEADNGWRAATYYSYDVHGNVDTLIQDYGNSDVYPNAMNSVDGEQSGNRWKKIVYRYDLISGKVNFVIYQPNSVDAFYHHYIYDAENRITNIETSKDSIYWETDARYEYYKHGPLSRTVLGQQQVQGLDYIYTLQGWLKAINPVAPLLGGTGGGEGCDEGTGVNDLEVNTRTGNSPAEYAARETITFDEGFINGDVSDYFDAVIDATLPLCTKSNSNLSGCGSGTAINELVVNARTGNAPAEYIARVAVTLEEGFENGDNDYFDAVIDESLLECKAAGTGYYATTDGTNVSPVAKDAYSFVLNYYDNDYKGIDFPSPSLNVAAQLGSDYRPLFNGNISSMGVSIDKLNNPLLYNYQYDQLNRLVSMDAWQVNGTSWSSLNKIPDFKEDISYDPNGNILTYNRNGNNTFAASPLAMDSLTYHYSDNTNQLNYIHDTVPDSNYPNDLDKQLPGNYHYDQIGNLTHDEKEGIDSIEWTVYGKISKITKRDSTTIEYTYDASGNRISKAVTKNGHTTSTWYVRDASGNVMSVYEAGNTTLNSGHLTQSEIHLYGSSRLGIFKDSLDVQVVPTPQTFTLSDGSIAYITNFTRARKIFELTNHLGNVLATVSDRKLPMDVSNDSTIDYMADVQSANDYYPGGMQEPGRSFNSSSYRYSINGQEKETELNENITTAEYWEYDSRSVRRWNVDPITKPYESPYSVFGNNPISIVDPNGSDTLTFIKNTTIRKAVTMKSNLDGTPSKTIIPGSITTTGDINIRAGDGPDVFYYQENVTTIDPSKGTTSTVNGKLQEFNPTGSASNFYRTGGWSGIMGPQYDDRNVLAMVAPRWLLTYYAGKSSGPQKWAYQTAIANQSDLPFIAGLQKLTNAGYTIAGVYGVATLALRQAAVAGLEGGENFFINSNYSSKVFKQMNNTPDLYHAFPRSVDGFAAKFGRWTIETGGDGKAYEWLRLPGSWAGKNGVFEYTKDANGIINHRYFNPTP